MSIRITGAVAARVLTQVRRDPRTLVMLLAVPSLLMALLWWLYSATPMSLFGRIAPALLALLPFILMFLVTSVTTLRERTSGTLERALTTPMGKLDLVVGYGLAFGLIALVQTSIAIAVSTTWLGLDLAGSVWLFTLVAVLDAFAGTALGLLVSAFARTEFQAVQFMPVLIVPQIFLCGLLVPREQLPGALEALSNVLPLSYAVEAMNTLSTSTVADGVGRDIAVVIGFIVVFIALGAATLRRRTQ